jgi:3-oxoacyl-[acyl-carrier protein] reductase
VTTEPNVGGFVVGSAAQLDHVMTAKDVERFVEMTGDDNPLHVDREFAERTSFKGIVAHGMLSASFISTIIGKHIPGRGALWMSQSLDFLLPVRIGDRLQIRAVVTGVQVSQRILTIRTEIRNQRDQLVLGGESKVKLLDLPEAAAAPAAAKLDVAVAIVTGASRGIGAATARRLARDGFAIVVDYRRDEEGARRVVEQITRENGRAVAIRADVSRPDDVRDLVDAAMSEFGALSAIVNNASDALSPAPFAGLSIGELSRQMDLHYYAPFQLIQRALPHLERAANAAVVNVGSVYVDNVPAPQIMSYAAAKAALTSMTRSLALEFGPKGIRFNIVSPGMTDTAMIANVPDKAKLIARMQTPLRRLADPADVADGIAFLLSPQARHITGETLRISGGSVML